MGVSRLQKLFNLLEGGSSEATRKAAARQIAEIAQAHPEQLPSVLRKVSACVYSKSWDTRIAAGEAIAQLADIFVHHTAADLTQAAGGSAAPGSAPASISFTTFNLKRILDKGSALLASGGQEFDIVEDASLTPKERLEKQRKQLKKRLGLTPLMEGIIDTDSLLADEDMVEAPPSAPPMSAAQKALAEEASKTQATELLLNMDGLSARERNKLKRKAKVMGRTDSLHGSLKQAPIIKGSDAAAGLSGRSSSARSDGEQGSGEAGVSKGAGGAGAGADNPGSAGDQDEDEDEWRRILAGEWPFQRLCDQLCVDILDPVWEVRHGAAVALREVLRTQAGCAGVTAPMADLTSGWASAGGCGRRPLGLVSTEAACEVAEANRAWLEDCLILLLCVLALDRFGDYGSDQVTAPVRETAAQALGMALGSLEQSEVQGVLGMLGQLMGQPIWDVRCGGYLGLKYALAGRLDLGRQLLTDSLPALLAGLSDEDDDVRAASADALVPLAPTLFSLGRGAVGQVRALLWALLGQLEELSPATMSVMALLAALYAQQPSGGGAGGGGGCGGGGLAPGAGEGGGSGGGPAGALAVAGAGAATGGVGAGASAGAAAAGADAGDEAEASDALVALVPRLWLFLRHSMTSVRLSTVLCHERLLLASSSHSAPSECVWLPPLLPALLLLMFQNLLLECDTRVLEASVRVWRLLVDRASVASVAGAATGALTKVLLSLASTPTGSPLDAALMVTPKVDADSGAVTLLPLNSVSDHAAAPAAATSAAAAGTAGSSGAAAPASKKARKEPKGSSASSALAPPRRRDFVVGSHGEGSAVAMRLACAHALGHLVAKVSGHDGGACSGEVIAALSFPAATARSTASLVLWHWAGSGRQGAASLPTEAHAALASLLSSAPSAEAPYTETVPFYAQVRREASALAAGCLSCGLLLPLPPGASLERLSADQALSLASDPAASSGAAAAPLAARLASAATGLAAFEQYLHLNVLACAAAACVRAGPLPAKLNGVIQPLMSAVRKEPEVAMQAVCAEALAELVVAASSRSPCPNDKLVKNVCAMACCDPAETLSASDAPDTLDERRASHAGAGARGAPRAKDGGDAGGSAAAARDAAAAAGTDAAAEGAGAAVAAAARTTRLGAEAALRWLAVKHGAGLWGALPGLWATASGPVLAAAAALDGTATEGAAGGAPPPVPDLQAVIHALQVLKVLGPHVHADLVPSLEGLLPGLCACSRHGCPAVRTSAARTLAGLASSWLPRLMPPLLHQLLPLLSAPDDDTRLGGVETVAQLVAALGFQLVRYTVLLVVPLLRRMADAVEGVRRQATRCFGALVALLPLAQGQPPPDGLDAAQVASMTQDSTFLLQLLDNKTVEDFALPQQLQLPVALRRYQQEGINWLAFLRRFGLHGVLADDMGLGKTIQASCIMGAAVVEAQDDYLSSGDPALWPRACLVVCPSTLVQHWVHEVGRYIPTTVLRPRHIHGLPAERARIQAELSAALAPPHPGSSAALAAAAAGAAAAAAGGAGAGDAAVYAARLALLPAVNLVVMSYDHVRADVEWVSSRQWLYCVLDEGHIIKNPKARATQCVKRVVAQHRLLLSGTPVQNNALELWSLFDFLMPGFLGTERDFNAKYGKAVQAARYSKRGSRELEVGMLAVESLHKQVMPFVLRRTKAQVLHDLPPKIIQDVYCDMSPLQAQLYEDFHASSASAEVSSALQEAASGDADGGGCGKGKAHVFRAMQYMRKLCSHPSLVLDLSVPEHAAAVAKVVGSDDRAAVDAALADVEVAPKLAALRDLLAQCGIGSDVKSEPKSEDDGSGGGLGAGHRVLVFAQLKGMLDLAERHVLVPRGVSFLRLDGSLDSSARFGVVQRFNADPTIDVLLLTTAVGGLGLNLTSADTVVFLEHDWNPMKDLQAMDRAHRLGQTRTVNVYRLLMRDTIEEKVMGLQQFKIDMANAVVNSDNVSLGEMDTTQLLELFGTGGQQAGGAGAATAGAVAVAGASGGDDKKKSGLQAMLAGMGEMWDEEQYSSEFSMDAFMGKLKKA
ncbi:hypothetical protein FOA52_014429 [Chlamydomonas sp. UWO 241]|nr:hypothetical protein FOA52_014429 [Chlamydomonas sp. UWO 241]